MLKFDNFDLSQYLREEYDGKEFDMVEQVGDWEGYDVHLGYTQEGEYITVERQKAWYASEDDRETIEYIFDLQSFLYSTKPLTSAFLADK